MRPARKLGKLEETKNKYKTLSEIERKEEGSPLKQSVGLIWERKIWENMQKLKINIESPSESTGNSRPVLMGEWWLQQAYIWQNRTNPLTEERISQPCKCFIFRFDEYMPNREHDTASLLAVLLFSILMIKVFNEILAPLEVLKVTVSPTRFSQDTQQSNCPDIAPYQPLLDLLILNYGWQLWHITNQILRWRWKVKCWWYPSQVPQLPWMSLPEASGLGNLTNDDDDGSPVALFVLSTAPPWQRPSQVTVIGSGRLDKSPRCTFDPTLEILYNTKIRVAKT